MPVHRPEPKTAPLRLILHAVRFATITVFLVWVITWRYVWWYHLSVTVVLAIAVGLLHAGRGSRFVRDFVGALAGEAAKWRHGSLRAAMTKVDLVFGLAFIPVLAGVFVLDAYGRGEHARVAYVLGALTVALCVSQTLWEFAGIDREPDTAGAPAG
ncbi:hypothetical protein Afil01_40450 [Actinorhabdospora filicis]|uniref:Uncharacterized protein n=1 Tax=Actinorhabdospora filicis TaxID=1785913 RepID=A0A9W6WAP9_9ACTN|nr:hypothetical protein [Actinorhabdospora filicis]GLZ79238.1 hypothetical protein Afil01_40450 [Actinorhabdospora filicis]